MKPDEPHKIASIKIDGEASNDPADNLIALIFASAVMANEIGVSKHGFLKMVETAFDDTESGKVGRTQ